MIKNEFSILGRLSKEVTLIADLVIIGGGMAGTCCAIAAAREGLKVVLVQDRPVLGGNASSEVRLWILGATSSMGNNNRWAREGGVLNEILVENMYRNPDGNAILLDTIILEKVIEESNITLLLNTAAYSVIKSSPDKIKKILAFCSQNAIQYILEAPYFCDASGDGIVAFQAGAAFRMGAESKDEFDEKFAPDQEYGELLGHSIYFYSKDMGRPISYTAPSYALKDVSKIVKSRSFDVAEDGCRLWWLEYGGRLDTVHDTEEIKWELWKVIYGIWDHVKNSGKYPEAENLSLEWVGAIPGKRESRRFEGEYMLSQKDVVEQREHADAVGYGGWALDLHPADGVFSDKPGCTQWHSKGIYQIPLRCLFSKNIKNLWLAGRIISASHVAFGSSRVMGTVAYCAQVIGLATRYCLTNKLTPSALVQSELMVHLQQQLLLNGHYIPNFQPKFTNLASIAKITASSEFQIGEFLANGDWQKLEFSTAQLLPLNGKSKIKVTLQAKAEKITELVIQLRLSEKVGGFTPEKIIQKKNVKLQAGINEVIFKLDTDVDYPDQYAFLCILENKFTYIKTSKSFLTGTMMVKNRFNKDVAKSGIQSPPNGNGIDKFEFWVPSRRPALQNLALQITPPLKAYPINNIINGCFRPTTKTNAWLADLEDPNPHVQLKWKEEKEICKIVLFFDSDFDHPLESTLRVHPERVVPHTVRDYKIMDAFGVTVFEKKGNYQTVNTIVFEKPFFADSLNFYFSHPSANTPAALFEVQVF